MNNNRSIINNIEYLREKLNLYLLCFEPTNRKVVRISQQLDKYLVLYEKTKLLMTDSA